MYSFNHLTQTSEPMRVLPECLHLSFFNKTADLPLTPRQDESVHEQAQPSPGLSPFSSSSTPSSPHNSSTQASDFQSLPSEGELSPPQLSSHRVVTMSEYVIPEDATAEMLKKLISETEVKLHAAERAVDSATNKAEKDVRKCEERRLHSFLQRLESRSAKVEASDLKGTVTRNSADIAELKDTSSKQGEMLGDMQVVLREAVQRIVSLEKHNQQMQKQVEAVDSRLRRQNMIVFGLFVDDIDTVVNGLFHGAHELLDELDDAFFLGGDPSRKIPVKLQFKSCSAANQFLSYAKRAPFTTARNTRSLSVGRDTTVLRRVGTSRLAAATAALLLRFPEAQLTPAGTAVWIEGHKYDAIEFAAPVLRVGPHDFDVDKACRENDNYEESSLSLEQGDSVSQAYKKKGSTAPQTNGGMEADDMDTAEDANDAADDNNSRVARGGGGQRTRGGGRGGGGSNGHRARGWGRAATAHRPQRGGGRGAGAGRGQASMTAPNVSGTTTGGVAVHAGGNYISEGRLDMVGAVANRYEVRG